MNLKRFISGKGKKLIVLLFLGCVIFVSVAGITPPKEQYRNLQVLSKKIDEDQMERIMYNFDKQLGVTCVYCHDSTRNVFPARADFASDAKKEKRIAREMLQMCLGINKKYFDLRVDKEIRANPIVWCRTCHMGLPVPNNR